MAADQAVRPAADEVDRKRPEFLAQAGKAFDGFLTYTAPSGDVDRGEAFHARRPRGRAVGRGRLRPAA